MKIFEYQQKEKYQLFARLNLTPDCAEPDIQTIFVQVVYKLIEEVENDYEEVENDNTEISGNTDKFLQNTNINFQNIYQ